MEQVTSRQNALVKELRELARGRGGKNDALLDGPHLIEEALASHVALRVAAIDSDAADHQLGALAARVASAGARVVSIPQRLFTTLSPVRHPSGIVAIARVTRHRPADIFTAASPLVLLLDRVQDPGNVGAIVRAAEGCGATGIVIAPGTADPFGWKALRGGMGSTFRVPIASAASLMAAVTSARAAGLRVIATAPRGGTPLARGDLSQPAAIVLGGEGSGLPPDILEAADDRITIPMRPPVESLNVAIAAALVLYEASRQRN